MKNMVMIDWESESYPHIKDFLAVPFFALLFTALRLFLDTFIFEILARRLIFGKRHVKLDMEVHHRRKKLNKFKESAWKCIYFFSAEVLALSVTYNEPWFTNTKNFWVGPGDQVWPDQKTKLKLKFLYMFVAGFYTYSIFALLFWETRRSDFQLSMAHHITSVTLIVFSYIFRFARVGSVVLALHDASDIFMEIAKMSLYSGYQWSSNLFFFLFVLFWTVLRIIYFPFWIIWSTSYEVIFTFGEDEHRTEEIVYYYVFNTLLFSLLFLHIYWWILMLRMVVALIARGKIEKDVRSDSEDEDEDHND